MIAPGARLRPQGLTVRHAIDYAEPMTLGPISAVSVLVADYDAAIAWFSDRLGFVLVEDTPLDGGKRWVRMAPEGGGTHLLLARAVDDIQSQRVGDQAAGRVFLFLETDDFDSDHAALAARGVEFTEAPRHESYGKVAVFRDCSGNRWDLIEYTNGG